MQLYAEMESRQAQKTAMTGTMQTETGATLTAQLETIMGAQRRVLTKILSVIYARQLVQLASSQIQQPTHASPAFTHA